MTKSLDALRAEAQRDPHADAPRTVLADALEQQGEVDRAQLIHLQVQRAALPAWDPKVVALELKERAILARCEAAWRAELPQLAGVTWGSFTRGFVSKVAFDKPELVARHRDACLGATPIHGVAIRWPKGKTRPALEAIEGLTELTVVGTVMHHEDLKWLASCPILATVDALNLVDSNLRQGPFALLASPHLANVTAVRVPSNQLGDNGATALFGPLAKVAEIDLSITSYPTRDHGSGRESSQLPVAGARAVEKLASWKGLSNVHALDVSGWQLGRDGLAMLLASPYTKGLTSLRIRDIADADWDMDDSLAAFAAGPAGALDVLDIGANDLDGDGAGYLANGKALDKLRVLRLDNVRSNHFDRLGQARWIHQLHVLAGDEDAIAPIVRRAPQRLHTLEVSSRAKSQTLVALLAKSPLPALARLDLSAVALDDAGVRQLAALDTLPKLVELRLRPRGRGQQRKPTYSRPAVTELAKSALGNKLLSLDVGIPELDKLPPPHPPQFGDGEYDGPARYL